MQRPDWKIAGAAGLLAGLTVGGFTFVSASGADRAVRTIELDEAAGAAASPALRWIDESSDSPQTFDAASSPFGPAATSDATDSAVSVDSTDSPDVVAKPIVEERAATAKPKAKPKPAKAPAPAPADSDSSDSDSSDSASADSSD